MVAEERAMTRSPSSVIAIVSQTENGIKVIVFDGNGAPRIQSLNEGEYHD